MAALITVRFYFRVLSAKVNNYWNDWIKENLNNIDNRIFRFYEKIINPTVPVTKDGWADFAKINSRKWTVRQDRYQRDEIIDDATTESLSNCLFDSYSRSFDDEEREEFILPNDMAEDYKVYEDIAEEETNGIIIINTTTEEDDPEDKTLVPEDAQDDNYVFLAPSSQDVRFLKERE